MRWRGRARDEESDGGRRLVRDRDADPGQGGLGPTCSAGNGLGEISGRCLRSAVGLCRDGKVRAAEWLGCAISLP